jgi:predicted MFS family arabinose efflux permease
LKHSNKGKLWGPSYIILLCASALSAVAVFMTVPTIPKYVISLGSSLTVAGTISGIAPITSLVVRPFSGMVLDKYNKKWIMTIFTGISGLTILGYALSAKIPVLLSLRVLNGLAFAVSGTASIAIAGSFVPGDRMGEGIGYIGLAQILASAVGPHLGLNISYNLGYRKCFSIFSGLSMLAALLMILIRYRKTNGTKPEEKKKVRFRDFMAIELIPLTVFGGLFSLGNGLIMTFIALMGESRGIKNIEIYFTVNAIMLFLIRPLAGKLYDRKGLSLVLIPAFILDAIAMCIIGLANSIWMVVLAGLLRAIGQGAGQPSIQAECIKRLGKERSGVATSTYFFGADICQGFGPIIGGAIIQYFGYGAMYLGCSGIIMCGLIGYIIYRDISLKNKVSAKAYEMH